MIFPESGQSHLTPMATCRRLFRRVGNGLHAYYFQLIQNLQRAGTHGYSSCMSPVAY